MKVSEEEGEFLLDTHTPEETAAYVRDEVVKWKKVATAAGVKGE